MRSACRFMIVAMAALMLAFGFDAGASGFASNGYGDHSPHGYSMQAGFAVELVLTLGFLIVILGVVMGFQISAWNGARQERREVIDMMAGLAADVELAEQLASATLDARLDRVGQAAVLDDGVGGDADLPGRGHHPHGPRGVSDGSVRCPLGGSIRCHWLGSSRRKSQLPCCG